MSGLVPYLGNESLNRITKSELRKAFPWQDLHSFGVILEEFLSEEVIRTKLLDYMGPRSIAALHHIRERLKHPKADSRHYSNAREVQQALERVPFGSIAPLQIAELAPVPEKGVVLPTSRRGPGSDRMHALIAHPLFQRLHNLPQLGLLHLILPGATHSRFVHALHTYDLARVAICHQLGNWDFRLNVEAKDVDCTLFGALLDSVGRYHFQHMFEDFIDRNDPSLTDAALLPDHELLDAMMGTADRQITAEFGQIKDSSGRSLGEIFESCVDLGWDQLRERQRRPSNRVQGFLSGLLSSPVDVDKLAYLIDDSAFTGLPFGQAVLPTPIFEALRMPHANDWSKTRNRGVVVALREKALSYVEQAVLSRYWNIQTGYWYRTNRSLQAMVKHQIGALLKGRSLKFDEFIMGTLHLSANGALHWLDRAFKQAIRDGSVNGESVDPLDGILSSRREIYKRLVTISPKSQLESRGSDRYIYEGLRRRSPLDDDQVCEKVARVLESLKPGLRVLPGEVLLDLPRVRREESGGKVLVYADEPGAELIGDLFTISPVLSGLQEQFDFYAKRLRIFIHPRLEHELEGIQEKAHRQVLDMLRDDFDGGRRE
jgi:HD superfamily phosphohydrolase